MSYTCKHFNISELVYPKLYLTTGNTEKLWVCFDVRLLVAIDAIKEFLTRVSGVNCPVVINNWKTGGTFRDSGLRDMDNKAVGAGLSQHKFGRAADLKFNCGIWNPSKLREFMKSEGCFEPGFLSRTDADAAPFQHIRRIEWIDNMGWFHLDVYNSDLTQDTIKIIKG